MIVMLLIEYLMEVQCLKGGCTGSSESTLVNVKLLEISYHDSLILFSCFRFNLVTRTTSSLVTATPLL